MNGIRLAHRTRLNRNNPTSVPPSLDAEKEFDWSSVKVWVWKGFLSARNIFQTSSIWDFIRLLWCPLAVTRDPDKGIQQVHAGGSGGVHVYVDDSLVVVTDPVQHIDSYFIRVGLPEYHGGRGSRGGFSTTGKPT